MSRRFSDGSCDMAETIMPVSMQIDTALEEDRLAFQACSDRDAFSSLYRRYVGRVYRYLYSRTGNAQDAEDLTAQVFTAVIESLPRYQGQGNFAGWLFTIARRRALNARRGRVVFYPLEAAENRADCSGDILDQVIRAEQIRRLQNLLRQFNEEEIELLRLRYTAGLSYRQIGEVVRKRESAVAMAFYRLLRRLEERWEDENEQ